MDGAAFQREQLWREDYEQCSGCSFLLPLNLEGTAVPSKKAVQHGDSGENLGLFRSKSRRKLRRKS